MKKILLVGPQWHGGITEDYARAFLKLGCEVRIVHTYVASPEILEGKMLEALNRTPFLPLFSDYVQVFRKILTVRTEQTLKKRLTDHLLQEALTFSPSLIFFICCNTMVFSFKELKKKISVPFVAWWVDEPFTRWFSNPLFRNYELTRNLLSCDHLFVWDSFWLPLVENLVSCPVDYLPHAVDPEIFKPLSLLEEDGQAYACEVGFVGSSYYGTDGSGIIRARFLEGLKNYKVKIYGDPAWTSLIEKDFPNLKSFFQGTSLSQKELNKFYNVARLVLNIHHPQCIYGTNQRTFEIVASGGFPLMEYRKEIPELLGVEAEKVCFKTVQELRDRVSYYLNHEREREALIHTLRRTVLAKHTYPHRAQFILDRVGLLCRG